MAPGELGEGNSRRAHHFSVVGDISEDSTLGGNLDAVPNLEVAGKSTLAGNGDVIAELGRTGDADLRDEQAMFPDLHVVADLDQVIDLGPLAYHGFSESRAV